MLDIILISFAILSSIFQFIELIGISYYKLKSKNAGLHVVTNLLFDYIPHFLFMFSLVFIIYSLTHSDTTLLIIVISLTITFILNIEILVYNKESFLVISFPFKKEEFRSFKKQGKFFVVENEKRQKIIHLSSAKIEKILAYYD